MKHNTILLTFLVICLIFVGSWILISTQPFQFDLQPLQDLLMEQLENFKIPV